MVNTCAIYEDVHNDQDLTKGSGSCYLSQQRRMSSPFSTRQQQSARSGTRQENCYDVYHLSNHVTIDPFTEDYQYKLLEKNEQKSVVVHHPSPPRFFEVGNLWQQSHSRSQPQPQQDEEESKGCEFAEEQTVDAQEKELAQEDHLNNGEVDVICGRGQAEVKEAKNNMFIETNVHGSNRPSSSICAKSSSKQLSPKKKPWGSRMDITPVDLQQSMLLQKKRKPSPRRFLLAKADDNNSNYMKEEDQQSLLKPKHIFLSFAGLCKEKMDRSFDRVNSSSQASTGQQQESQRSARGLLGKIVAKTSAVEVPLVIKVGIISTSNQRKGNDSGKQFKAQCQSSSTTTINKSKVQQSFQPSLNSITLRSAQTPSSEIIRVSALAQPISIGSLANSAKERGSYQFIDNEIEKTLVIRAKESMGNTPRSSMRIARNSSTSLSQNESQMSPVSNNKQQQRINMGSNGELFRKESLELRQVFWRQQTQRHKQILSFNQREAEMKECSFVPKSFTKLDRKAKAEVNSKASPERVEFALSPNFHRDAKEVKNTYTNLYSIKKQMGYLQPV